MSKYYNNDIKVEFEKHLVDLHGEKTAKAYMASFKRSSEMEEFLKKDLYLFTEGQILDVITAGNHASVIAAKSVLTHINAYITWAIQNGLTPANINPVENITTDDIEKAISHNKKFHITEEELIKIEDKLVNAQDKYVLRALFEGVRGQQFSEIRNLKIDDVQGNDLRLTGLKGEVRTATFSDRFIEIIKSAYEEEYYQYSNGKSDSRIKEAQLKGNGYIFKQKLATRNIGSKEAVPAFHVYRSMEVIKEVAENPYLDPYKIQISGQIAAAKKYLDKHSTLDKYFYEELAKQYNINKTNSYNTTKSQVNLESVKELYG